MSGFSWNLIGDLRAQFFWEFMRNAYAAGTIIAIVAGVVSYLVVLRRSSFAAHALGHIGFSGAAGAVLFAINPLYGLLLATTTSGVGIAALGKRAAHRDVEIGTVLAFMLGLGLLFLSFYRGFATEAYSILFGEIVGVSTAQVLFTLGVSLAVLLALGLVYRQIIFASLDEEVAEAKGMPTLLLGIVFMLALAVAVSIAVTVIGVLLIFALTVTPAAIAIRLARRPAYAVLISVLIALGATWGGIFIGYYATPEPTSFFIVTIVFVAYAVVRAAPLVRSAFAGIRRVQPAPSRAIGTAAPTSPTGTADENAPLSAARPQATVGMSR